MMNSVEAQYINGDNCSCRGSRHRKRGGLAREQRDEGTGFNCRAQPQSPEGDSGPAERHSRSG